MIIIEQCENAENICQVMHLAFEHYKEDPIPSSALVETPQTIEKELQKGIRVWGGKIDEQLIAIVKIDSQDDGLYFSRLSVIPSMQGHGYAEQFVRFIETQAKMEGKRQVTCKVRSSEEGNIQLYRQLGFEIVAEETIPNILGQKIQTVSMRKVI
ncbi:GNAT family N-acetyltransferase [Solibacillus sp. FSL K6-1523]|uniref:GNAT family N-acetyltransferase n=1 Tax=Solibacillus sp. FSL K6-1523 TaxID=2921471 RepID=UPI0030F4CC51